MLPPAAGTQPTAIRPQPYTNVRTDPYYDPATGQFVTVDPLVDQTEQAYAYVGGDPVNLTDPSGQSIPIDFGDRSSIYTASGGSNGAHPGAPVWGGGSANGYTCTQQAWDENLPGVREGLLDAGYGDLSGPTGWAYWGPLLGTLGAGAALIAAPEIVEALPEVVGAGVEQAQAQATVIRAQLRTVVKLLQDSVSTDPLVRRDALEELERRVRIANGAAEGTLPRPGTARTIVARAAAKWIYTFVRGY